MKPFRVALWYRKTNQTQARRENTVSCFLYFLWTSCPRTHEFENHSCRNVAGILMGFCFWSQVLNFIILYVSRLLSSKELSSKATQTFSLHPFIPHWYYNPYIKRDLRCLFIASISINRWIENICQNFTKFNSNPRCRQCESAKI